MELSDDMFKAEAQNFLHAYYNSGNLFGNPVRLAEGLLGYWNNFLQPSWSMAYASGHLQDSFYNANAIGNMEQGEEATWLQPTVSFTTGHPYASVGVAVWLLLLCLLFLHYNSRLRALIGEDEYLEDPAAPASPPITFGGFTIYSAPPLP